MTAEEKNEAIAKILGFKKYTITGTAGGEAWICPMEYSYLQAGTPMWQLPDFLKIIDRHQKIREIL